MQNGFVVKDEYQNIKSYDGNTRKFGITVNGQNYLVKMSKDSLSSIYSEYIASRFMRNIGINAHEVWIGLYEGQLVNIIKDFTTLETTLRAYKGTRQSSEGTDMESKRYTYKDVMDMINKHTKMSDEVKKLVIKQFWQMFICDAILGNRDRHHGNWGYLYNETLGKMMLAPIYDNGGSLFPDVDRVIGSFNASTEKKFLFERSEFFPASLFMVFNKDGKVTRSNYYEILGDLRISRVLASEVRGIINKVGYPGVSRAIQEAVGSIENILTPAHQVFYTEVTCLRYLHIIERKSLDKSYRIIKGESQYVKRTI